MRIVALIGRSGTGKSYKSIMLAKELNIEYIIDDGLFIKGNKIITGKSAKGEESRIRAVKRALFSDKDHRLDVRMAIQEMNPESILVLGTSDKMVDKIVIALGLPSIESRIYVEQICTPEEIEIAQEYRKKQGKHVIPVPTFEVKKDFSGYFIDTLKIFRDKDTTQQQVYEKTVVRPTFSYLGKYTISDSVIRDLAKFVANNSDGIHKIYNIYTKNYKEGVVISLNVAIKYGNKITDFIKKVQEKIGQEVEQMTSINVLAVNVTIKRIVIN
ncbi:hypothetical protein CLPU_2c00580 [Gottschalkia purinilytica]|uniref:Asp23/Gls24 family envelope stress response protein n=1 Tax=Gottschalkia purinilytica TaxID=1503 RepID=A0A0L0WDQ4_GOTPU|nr:Asp23/Gls24 family envelope stress response protein [Gottschalkia purinilytica]KNF09607.1 hypothetical protein CLPU_2c00580 [Gottschalkia purinilytica]